MKWVETNTVNASSFQLDIAFGHGMMPVRRRERFLGPGESWREDLSQYIEALDPAEWTRLNLVLHRYLRNSCSFCLEDLNNGSDHTRCTLVLFKCDSCGQEFNSVAKRRAHTCCPGDLVECAVDGLFRIYNINHPELPSPDYLHVLLSCQQRLVRLVDWLRSQEGSLKIYIAVHIELQKLVDEAETMTLWFKTSASEILGTTDLAAVITQHIMSIDERVEGHVSRGSGWIIKNMLALHLNVTPYRLQKGGSYLPLPEELKKFKKSLINVDNRGDHFCFLWSILACLHHNETRNPSRRSFYYRFMREIDFDDLSFPLPLKNVKLFEHKNGVAINVLGYKSGSGFYTEYRSDFLRDFPVVINLLYLRDLDRFLNPIGHYVAITNLPRLLNTSTNRSKKYVCVRCHTLFISDEVLRKHEVRCMNFGVQKVEFPLENTIEFTSFRQMIPLPVWLILDLESCLVTNNDRVGQNTTNVCEHIPCSYSLKVCSNEYPQFDLPPEYYVGSDVIEHLMSRLDEIYHELDVILSCNTPMTQLTPEEEHRHETSPNCHICLKPFQPEDIRVRDHQHHPLRLGQTSNYIGPAHVLCNAKRSVEKRLVIIAHNMSGYDLHLFINELCDMNADRIDKVHLLPQTLEKYISLSTPDMKFVDSMRHLQSSLDSLVNDLKCLGLDKFRRVKEYVQSLGKGDAEVELLTKKAIFCYDYLTSVDVLTHPIPPRLAFHNSLTNTPVSDSEWDHLQSLVRTFNLSTVGDLLQLYNTLDTLLTADVWSNYRSWSLEVFGLEPGHYVSGPGLCWDAALKMTRPKLAMLKDVDAMMMFESGIRGGITCVSKRYAEANNPDCPDYDPSSDTTYLGFYDAVSLYGASMTGKLPYNDFKWESEDKFESILGRSPNGDRGYVLQVDIVIPARYHDFLNQYPTFPENIEITADMLSPFLKQMLEKNGISRYAKTRKLAPNLLPKFNYVIDLENLQYYLSLGGEIVKIHCILSFHQKAWLKPWVDFHTEQRRIATTAVRANFHKFSVNFIFGKSMESTRKYKNVVLVNRPNQHCRQVCKNGFKRFYILSPELVAVELARHSVKLDKPVYTGFRILENSKLRVFKFFYDVLRKNLKDVELVLTDTDSLLVKYRSNNYVRDLQRISDHFDFSNLPSSHPLHSTENRLVPGKFKCEVRGCTILNCVALRPKMYSIDMLERTSEGGIRSKRKVAGSGIKRHVLTTASETSHDAFYTCLMSHQSTRVSQKTFRTKKHKVYTVECSRVGLSNVDTKRFILNCGVESLAYGHHSISAG